jgi:hypothetical protein
MFRLLFRLNSISIYILLIIEHNEDVSLEKGKSEIFVNSKQCSEVVYLTMLSDVNNTLYCRW